MSWVVSFILVLGNRLHHCLGYSPSPLSRVFSFAIVSGILLRPCLGYFPSPLSRVFSFALVLGILFALVSGILLRPIFIDKHKLSWSCYKDCPCKEQPLKRNSFEIHLLLAQLVTLVVPRDIRNIRYIGQYGLVPTPNMSHNPYTDNPLYLHNYLL